MAKKKSAREALAEWCMQHGRKVSLARKLSVNVSSVHRWCVGAATPSPMARVGIETVTKIPRTLWCRT